MRECWCSYFDVGNEEDVIKFAKSINTKNPLHLDNQAARQNGLLGIIVPGVMILGFVDSTITEEIPSVKICRLEVDFINSLYAGSVPFVSCIVLQRRKKFARVAVLIKNGMETVAKGSCLLLLPRECV